MKQLLVCGICAAGAMFFIGPVLGAATPAEGVALALVYDSSGSMADQVTDAKGTKSAKNVVALHALQTVSDRLAAYVQARSNTTVRSLDVALITFEHSIVKISQPLRPFTNTLVTIARTLKPVGGTPLGTAISQAWSVLEKSPRKHKHILVITDGRNTTGPNPEKVLADLKRISNPSVVRPTVHFIAFDVSSTIFEDVKKQDATVVEALNEKQLLYQVDYILTRKILLEAEE